MAQSSSKNKLTPEIITLHRYFIWGDRMRVHFDEVLGGLKPTEFSPIAEKKKDIDVFLYMSLWYGMFYVLIEGWQELKLEDERINTLLASQNVSLLRLYRNGVFHFQKEYFDEHFIKLMTDGQDIVNWLRSLREEFSRWFLDIHQQNK